MISPKFGTVPPAMKGEMGMGGGKSTRRGFQLCNVCNALLLKKKMKKYGIRL